MRTLTLSCAVGSAACLIAIVVVLARSDARHAAAGWRGSPPIPWPAVAFAALSGLLLLGAAVAGVAAVLTGS